MDFLPRSCHKSIIMNTGTKIIRKVFLCCAVIVFLWLACFRQKRPLKLVFDEVPFIHYKPQQTVSASQTDFLTQPTIRSYCQNIYKNITDGWWRKRTYNGIESDVDKLDKLLRYFRQEHEGFSANPYRDDLRCGFNIALCPWYECLRWKNDASAWCDHRSDLSCCSDKYKGKCVTRDQCIGGSSVNLAEYVHADTSDWVVKDTRCKMVMHSQASACSLLRNANVKSIGFVGNSLLRNIHSAMLDLLTDNFYNGSVKAGEIYPETKKRCVNQIKSMDIYCLAETMATSSEKLPHPGICRGLVDTRIYLEMFWLAEYGEELKEHAKSKMDKEGTYLFLGIGLHDQSNPTLVTQQYLKPTLELLKGHTWPKVRWVTTVRSGIFKPPNYVTNHGNDEKIAHFDREVATFCDRYGVPSVNLTKVTSGVWSQDGQHYGQGVNVVKAQIILNLIAEEYK
uniref:Uncharacterized protein n=1 Tax=Ciona savignyi TaxID=51511 RepID=H2YJD1_CIOSA